MYLVHGQIGNSASAIICDTSDGKFGPFAKQLFIADQSHSNLSRVFLETINGIKQGVVFPFRSGFTSGLIGGRMDEEGRIFVGGSDRGWGARGGKPYCFEKCEWTGKLPFEVHEMRAKSDGFELTFTQPVDAKTAGDVASYSMRAFVYAYRQYGGDEIARCCRRSLPRKSSSVYGASKVLPRKEGHEGPHLSPYSLSQRVNEELATMLMPYDSSFVGLRFFNVYGPGQSLMGYYTAVIPRLITEEHPEVYGDGETLRDFTFVDDVSDTIIKSLDFKNSAILNVGTGRTTSKNQLLLMLGKQGKAIYKEPRLGAVKASWADTTHAKNILKFTANISIESGLEQTKAFCENFLRESLLESKT